MRKEKIKINDIDLLAPEGHIYTKDIPKKYDYGPWEIIGFAMEGFLQDDVCLIDIGANIGDSIAHWRKFSNSQCLCIEPSEIFFSLLEINAKYLGDVHIKKSLLLPSFITSDNVKFLSGNQTGNTQLGTNGNYEGEVISIDGVFSIIKSKFYLFKTDTDGFDGYIMKGLYNFLKYFDTSQVPVIFTEGPSQDQMESRDYQIFLDSFHNLQEMGYDLILLSNFGTIFSYCGKNKLATSIAFEALSSSMSNGRAYCHYFDAIFILNQDVLLENYGNNN